MGFGIEHEIFSNGEFGSFQQGMLKHGLFAQASEILSDHLVDSMVGRASLHTQPSSIQALAACLILSYWRLCDFV